MTNDQRTASLKDASLRVTAPRLATIAVVEEQPHATAEAVATEVRDRLGSVSKQAIYDVLNALTDAGILRRVAVDGRGAQYEVETGDNHHHIVCSSCGRLEDVPCPVGEAPCMVPPEGDHGFAIERAEVTFRGLCADCQSTETNQPGHK
ncbi:MAG: transcriptional repressor [Propionibacterium sp.]|nr:transcriptional repressor [Propionibacterium sp.]